MELYRDEKWLRHMHIDKKVSVTKMAQYAYCHRRTIERWMDKYAIPRRNYREAWKLWHTKDQFWREERLLSK